MHSMHHPAPERSIQAYWSSGIEMDREIESWQAHWLEAFEDTWLRRHDAVCPIPGCSTRMVMDAGWKIFRAQVCEFAMPPTQLPVSTLQLRRICGAKACSGRRLCSEHRQGATQTFAFEFVLQLHFGWLIPLDRMPSVTQSLALRHTMSYKVLDSSYKQKNLRHPAALLCTQVQPKEHHATATVQYTDPAAAAAAVSRWRTSTYKKTWQKLFLPLHMP